jgi:tetratricopeptide (TPR) repeat protein
MTGTRKSIWRAAVLLGVLVMVAGAAFGQMGQGQSGQQSPQQNPSKPGTQQQEPPLQLEKQNPPTAPVTNPAEDAAYQAFVKAANGAGKIQAGEAFLQKYPQGRYCQAVYSTLMTQYLMSGQVDKTIDAGKKAIELNPNDMGALAVMGQVMARQQGGPDAAKNLDAAEQYSKKALELIPTALKPADASDEAFIQSKAVLLAMAHSGLGLVYLRRQKLSDAISELQAAVKDANYADPVDYYLLGLADEKASHYDDAAAAFTKCADIPGPMQARCKPMIDQAKKLATTELSAPK